jgi:hypothetical protein
MATSEDRAMNQPTDPSASAVMRHPWRRRLILIAGAAVFATVVVSGYRLYVTSQELADAIAETDRLDPGWRFEHLKNQGRFPPPAQNSALQALAAFSLLPSQWRVRPSNKPGESPLDAIYVLGDAEPVRELEAEKVAFLRDVLERVGPALSQALKLAAMPDGRYPVNWTTDVISTRSPWLDVSFDLSFLLELDSVLRNQDGDADGALVSARAVLNLGRSIGDEVFFDGPLSRNGRRSQCARMIERTLAQGVPSENALIGMQQFIQREEAVPLFLAYFCGRRAMTHVFLDRVHQGLNRISELNCVPKRGIAAHAEDWLGGPEARRTHARFLRGTNEAVEIAKLPVEQQCPLYRDWRARLGYVDKVGDGLTLAGWREDLLLSGHAYLRCAVAAVAADRYRIKHGAWPRALTALVPDYLASVPLDPFDGAPLRYCRIESGAVIYSIGKDGRDDYLDGEHQLVKSGTPGVVFTVWDIDRRRQPPKPP